MPTNLLVNAMLLTDGYKLGHKNMYPDGMTKLYSNFTPRTHKHFPDADKGAVVFGISYFVQKYLIEEFNNSFFNLPKEDVINSYKNLLEGYLGCDVAEQIGTEHISALHDLGYLPILIKGLPEGVYCPYGVPMLTITNTHPDFAWLTNYLETLLSNALWKPVTSATTADVFKRQLVKHAKKTGFNEEFLLKFLCHDFSMRGMSGVEDAIASGMAHLTSFSGTESVPAILGAMKYYNADRTCAATIPATEHSIECTNAVNGDIISDEDYFETMLTRFPQGFISIVADGFDYWHFLGNIVPKFKKRIMSRDGRVVIRPDSGDPVKIICGDPEATNPIVRMGSYEFLLKIFGGTVNEKGYMELDSHIGLIYGDAITMKRQREIYARLEEKGIAATNLVLGIGSFSMNCVSRDQLGMAMKATYCEINGEPREIFKDPKTVTSTGMTKKSLRGLIQVKQNQKTNRYFAIDGVSKELEEKGELITYFKDGKQLYKPTLSDIRHIREMELNNILKLEEITDNLDEMITFLN